MSRLRFCLELNNQFSICLVVRPRIVCLLKPFNCAEKGYHLLLGQAMGLHQHSSELVAMPCEVDEGHNVGDIVCTLQCDAACICLLHFKMVKESVLAPELHHLVDDAILDVLGEVALGLLLDFWPVLL